MAKEVAAGQGVIIKIPENTVRLEITASVMDEDGNVVKAYNILSPSDVYVARRDFLDYVGDDDYDGRALYVLTEKGRKDLGLDE